MAAVILGLIRIRRGRVVGCRCSCRSVYVPLAFRGDAPPGNGLHGHLGVAGDFGAGRDVFDDVRGGDVAVVVPEIACPEMIAQGQGIAVPLKYRDQACGDAAHGERIGVEAFGVDIALRVGGAVCDQAPFLEVPALVGNRAEGVLRARDHGSSAGQHAGIGAFDTTVCAAEVKLRLFDLEADLHVQRRGGHGPGQRPAVTEGVHINRGAVDSPARHVVALVRLGRKDDFRAVLVFASGGISRRRKHADVSHVSPHQLLGRDRDRIGGARDGIDAVHKSEAVISLRRRIAAVGCDLGGIHAWRAAGGKGHLGAGGVQAPDAQPQARKTVGKH
ncbi:hypothetical protein SDC9_42745 [bioreactor metagenome]|uniref:Uncharacterized protein n=1 Tax=bioreactor metagenome TaxID=1076179 RepID=A0A644W241_9ZZZZ